VEALPKFLRPENIRDKNGVKIGEPNYDPCTVLIPQSEWKEFTPGMFQYWEIKQDNFEKVFFFKLGKFYEIFYNDAILCNKLLDLNWMGGAKKLHIGFPEKVLDKYLQIMVDNGFKVAVVEQTENPRQLAARLSSQKGQKVAKSDKVVAREICNMVTKGTYKSANQGYEPKFVLSFKKHANEIGVCFFDVTTLQIQVGQFIDDE
jgi:DNA mismatch repair protein MSH6